MRKLNLRKRKAWKKSGLSARNIKQIEKAFYESIGWDGEQDLYLYMTNSIHPETDRWDDTVGVQPKQFKKLIRGWGKEVLNDLPYIFGLFNHFFSEWEYSRLLVISDGYPEWKAIWKAVFEEKPKKPLQKILSAL